jgi:glycosyltransferase involved in cell wall biosynthesis
LEVAVVIPCHDNAATLRAAVESALAQDSVAVDVVVVDDGSTDGSAETLAPLAGRVQVIRQANAGACAARNRGLAETTAPLVKFLDADDVLEPGCLAAQAAQAGAAGPDTVVFGRGLWVTPEGAQVGAYPPGPMAEGTVLSAADLVEASPLTSCPLHKRALLEAVGGFDPDCPRGQEHDLHIRLGLAGARFTFRDSLCYRYVQHVGGARISARQRRRDVCTAQIDVYERQFAMACDRGLVGDGAGALRQAFARHFWRHGRVCGRAGHDDLAARCFARSDVIAGARARGAVGSASYRLLARLLGGARIEALARVHSGHAQEHTR